MIRAVTGAECASYLRVEFAGVVQEAHANIVQSANLAGIISKALEGTAADISSAQQTLLDLRFKTRRSTLIHIQTNIYYILTYLYILY